MLGAVKKINLVRASVLNNTKMQTTNGINLLGSSGTTSNSNNTKMQTTNGINLLGSSGTTSNSNTWSNPERVEVNEVGETIEMIYKQTSMITYTVYPSPSPEVRVFKIVYSCIDGKWNKSEPIFGKIIPSQNEYFKFED